MKQYIDKSALVAEIEKRINFNGALNAHSRLDECNAILSILDSIEVKEVDLKKEIDDAFLEDKCNITDIVSLAEFERIAKHFFEFGLKAKDWKRKRMEECPYRQVGCTMYDGHILECKGACSWVVDYPKLKELKAQKGERYEI